MERRRQNVLDGKPGENGKGGWASEDFADKGNYGD
jgi:hypothetical protein